MNWIKENKFLAGLLVVLVLGVGAFGYLIMSASGKLADASAQYEQQANERTRLHGLKPYPSPDNVKELLAQKAEATAKVTQLHQALTGNELPVEPMAAVQFQDKLRDAVSEVTKAAGTTTKLPDKFFLGFERYETTTPDSAAAPLLGRQLKAIQWLVTRFIESKATEIRELIRDPLPEESGKSSEPAPAPASARDRGAKGDKAEKAGPPLVQSHGIDLVVVGDQATMRAVLNDIVGSKEQFFIPRLVSFKNQKERPPARAKKEAPAEGAAEGEAPAAPASAYIIGEEKVEMAMRLEMVDFADAGANPASK